MRAARTEGAVWELVAWGLAGVGRLRAGISLGQLGLFFPLRKVVADGGCS